LKLLEAADKTSEVEAKVVGSGSKTDLESMSRYLATVIDPPIPGFFNAPCPSAVYFTL
jgi:hypothetical protein